MHRQLLAVLVLLGVLVCLDAQETVSTYSSGHYTFSFPGNFTGIESVSDAFNGLWNGFNGVFGFDPDPAKHLLKVVILADKAAFDSYISSRIGETRNQYLFLKYQKAEQSELVLFPGNTSAGYESFAGPALNRQLFLQYLYSFVLEPPVWIRDGFQACFEKMTWDEKTKTVSIAGSSPWLETAKRLNADNTQKIDSDGILTAVTGTWNSARFYPQAWAFASFLLNSEKSGYQRFLHEAFLILEGSGSYNEASQQANTDSIKNRFSRFNAPAQTDTDFSAWLAGQHTFNELAQSGVSFYNAGNYSGARKDLLEAVSIRPDDPMIDYYLGLIAYAEKNYSDADVWYKKALALGAEASTVNWALGLNAYANKKYSESRAYLETAKSANPSRYAEKAATLINSMPK